MSALRTHGHGIHLHRSVGVLSSSNLHESINPGEASTYRSRPKGTPTSSPAERPNEHECRIRNTEGLSNGRDAGSNISELEKAQRVHDEAITNAILSDDKKEWEAHAEVAARALAKIITLTKGVVP